MTTSPVNSIGQGGAAPAPTNRIITRADLTTLDRVTTLASRVFDESIRQMHTAEDGGAVEIAGRSGRVIQGPIQVGLHSERRDPSGHIDRSGIERVTICSLNHILTNKVIDTLNFIIPPVPQGQFIVFQIYQTWCQQLNRDRAGAIGPGASDSMPELERKPLHARIMAESLVRTLAHDTLAGREHAPAGVGIIEGDLPTEFELDSLFDIHMNHCLWHVRQADAVSPENYGKFITPLHRLALEWTGDLDPLRHPWHREIKLGASVPCPNCTAPIPANGNYCKSCTTTLDEWCVARGIMPDESATPVLYANVQRLLVYKGISGNAPLAEVNTKPSPMPSPPTPPTAPPASVATTPIPPLPVEVGSVPVEDETISLEDLPLPSAPTPLKPSAKRKRATR